MNQSAHRRLVEGLKERGWVGSLVTPSANFSYLTDVNLEPSERFACYATLPNGSAWAVCPAFEVDRLAAGLADTPIVGWEETEDPFGIVADQMRMSEPGTWAVEPSTPYHDVARLTNAIPEAHVVDGVALFEELRRSKAPWEIEALRRAIDAAWIVFDECVEWLEPGISERQTSEQINRAFDGMGFSGWSLVQFGSSSAVPHGEAGNRALEPRTVVLIDWGGWRDGFGADLTRTFWWDEGVARGDAPAEFRKILDIVKRAQRAAIEVAGPGVTCGAVDAAARDLIQKAGYGQFFTHRLGHGLGREIHEPPYLVSGSQVQLAPGDVVTVEPGIYLPGRFGARWEDDVLITDDGVEVLSDRR